MLLRFYGQAALLCALAAAAMVGATCVDDPDGALTAHGGCPAVLGFGCSFDLSAVGPAPPGTLVELLCPLSCDKCPGTSSTGGSSAPAAWTCGMWKMPYADLDPDFEVGAGGCLGGAHTGDGGPFADTAKILALKAKFAQNYGAARASRATVKIGAQPWRTAKQAAFLESILLGEIMGFPTEVIHTSTAHYACVGDGTLDLITEVWPLPRQSQIDEWVTRKKSVAKAPIGYTGRDGYFISRLPGLRAATANQAALPAFSEPWESLTLQTVADQLSQAGAWNTTLPDGSRLCNAETTKAVWGANSTERCTDGVYYPPLCRHGQACAELITETLSTNPSPKLWSGTWACARQSRTPASATSARR